MVIVNDVKHGRTALVTGSTGMIGGEIVLALASHGWKVKTLVRARDDQEATKRIHDRLQKSGKAFSMDTEHIIAISGDVTEENLGLSPHSHDDISVIVHCAGETSFKEDAPCWNTNVGGAQRIIEFARTMPKPPKIFFMSTAFVCMSPYHSEISEDTEFGGYSNNYTRSKRHAEQLLLESGLDVVIFRPSIVLSRSIKDRRMARSILWVIPAMIELGEVPVDPNAHLDIVSVDYVADVVEQLLSKVSLYYKCYHISAGSQASATCSEIYEALYETYPLVRRLKLLGSGVSQKDLSHNVYYRRLMAAVAYYLPFINADIVYSNDRLIHELGHNMPACPKVTKYISELMAQFTFQEAIEESAHP